MTQGGNTETTVKAIEAAQKAFDTDCDGEAQQSEELYSRSVLIH